MKLLTYILLCLPFFVTANPLTIASAQIACLEKKQVHPNFPYKYRYGLELVVKNNSQKQHVLVTQLNTATVIANKQSAQVSLSYDAPKRNNQVIIPSSAELKLVELFPGDITLISHQFSHNELLENVDFELILSELYEGRFNNWTGRLNAPTVKALIKHQCKA